MTPRMVEVSKFNGKSWEPSGTAVFHGFFSDYEEFEAGPGNYPAALIEWEDGKIESVVAHSVRFLVPTLELERIKESVQSSWLSETMRKTETVVGSYPPPKGFQAIKEEGSWEPIDTAPKYVTILCRYDPADYAGAGDRPFRASQDQFGDWHDEHGDLREPDQWFKERAE